MSKNLARQMNNAAVSVENKVALREQIKATIKAKESRLQTFNYSNRVRAGIEAEIARLEGQLALLGEVETS